MSRLAVQKISAALKQDWYIQGFNAVPVFILPSAWSGFDMKSVAGFGYRWFLFHFNNGYCEMHYSRADLIRIWRKLSKILFKQPHYFEQLQKIHNQRFRDYLLTFQTIDRMKLVKISDDDLMALLRRCAKAQIESVGVSHVIESAGLALEKMFAEALRKQVVDRRDFNAYFSLLTTPSKLSFVAREERDLQKITERPIARRESALKQHAQSYRWIRNSYVEEVNPSIHYFRQRLAGLKPLAVRQADAEKAALIKKLRLDRNIQNLIRWIDVCTVWQDARKEKVLRSISYLGVVINELGRRTGLPRKYLHNLTALEILRLGSVTEVKQLKKDLISRGKGCLILGQPGHEIVVHGRDYRRLIGKTASIGRAMSETENEIHATTANGGTAIGQVVICRGIASLSKVKRGDIIVTSMTRPEFAPALKKAAAIVTDEGGITCHAAIVARELNIPCVIGAKIATKVLRDGMTIEVKASHGVVRILKK